MNMHPHSITLSFKIPYSTSILVNKVAEHYGLSRAVAGLKLLELGLQAIEEEFQKSSESLDTGTNKRVIHSLRKQL
jgi:hypothetical protein